MLIRYRVVTARPAPYSATSVGIGIIAEDPATERIHCRFIKKRTFRILEPLGVQPEVHSITQELEQRLDQDQEASTQPERFEFNLSPQGYLSMMETHWNGIVRISSPYFMEAPSVEAGLDFAFQDRIGLHAEPRKHGQHKRRRDTCRKIALTNKRSRLLERMTR